jgi:hypothetical protein
MYELVGGAAAARSMYVVVDHHCSKPSTVHDSIKAPEVVMSLPIGYLSGYRSEEHLLRERSNRAIVHIDFNLRHHLSVAPPAGLLQPLTCRRRPVRRTSPLMHHILQ